MTHLIDIFIHLDQFLNFWIEILGPWIYVMLFMVIFCETGLVVTPFLPGDSLLFAVGALAASPDSILRLPLIAVLLVIAAIGGDALNYAIGRFVGPKVFYSEGSIWLNRKHLLRAQTFYEKHGGKTIILARFMPIIRTFAPFVAGIGNMHYPRFASFNVIGALAWVLSFLLAGYFFGTLPFVKTNFHYVILAISVISFLPVAYEFLQSLRTPPPAKKAESN